MNLPKLLINIAVALVASGLLLLGFVAYQLWGTGIQHSYAQDSLNNSFDSLIAEADPINEVTTNKPPTDGLLISSISEKIELLEDTEFQLTDSVINSLPLLYRDLGEAIARIQIKEIGMNEIIVEGTQINDLKKGPGHYLTTPFPGQPGNVSIAGHRTTYGAPFASIQRLEEGDEILVTTIQGEFTYLVEAIGENGEVFKIVDPDQNEDLGYQGGNHLTLTSCHPRYSADERIIIRAKLQEGDLPAIALPRVSEISSGTETFVSKTRPTNLENTSIGLGENSQALLPTILFGILLLGLVVGMIIWSKKWIQWRVYLISAAPILAAIVFLYYYLDLYLPSF